jgi:PTH1 family peptidyl-tRNA hydrolase
MALRLIVGLGNPGQAYAATRHNVGFLVVDRILEEAREPAVERRDSLYRLTGVGGLLFLKPFTYMNRSGSAVRAVADICGIDPAEILLVVDCLDLPLGKLRLRQKGSSGGHRGVESVIRELETDAIARLRVGIGRPGADTVDYVLSPWADDEADLLRSVLAAAADAVRCAATDGMERAMNRYNGWVVSPDGGDPSKET